MLVLDSDQILIASKSLFVSYILFFSSEYSIMYIYIYVYVYLWAHVNLFVLLLLEQICYKWSVYTRYIFTVYAL